MENKTATLTQVEINHVEIFSGMIREMAEVIINGCEALELVDANMSTGNGIEIIKESRAIAGRMMISENIKDCCHGLDSAIEQILSIVNEATNAGPKA